MKKLKKCLSSLIAISMVLSLVVVGPFDIAPKVYAGDAAAGCTSNVAPSASALTGEGLDITVTVDNTGTTDVGFAPMIEVVLPAELSYSSASFSVGALALSPETNYTIIDDDAGDTEKGSATNGITDVASAADAFDVGSTYLAFRLPVGSFTPSQDPVGITVVADLDSGLPIAALADPVKTQCGFAFGEDALDNPSTDPIILSGFTDATINVTVIEVSKTVTDGSGGGADQETATGENYPLTYNISANIANSATVTALTLDETIPSDLQLVSIDTVDDDGGGFTITFTPSGGGGAQVSSSVPFTPTGPFPPGGTLAVAYTSITGAVADTTDAEFEFTAFVPDKDSAAADVLSPTSGASDTITNTADGNGTYGVTPVSDTSDSADYAIRSLAVQKSVSIDTDTGPSGYSPGDTLEYTVNFQLSDYFSFQDIVIDDVLPDGTTFVGSSASMSITEDGSTYPGITFTEATVSTQTNIPTGPVYDFSGAECLGCSLAIGADGTDDGDATDPPGDGQTVLVFDVSGAIDDAAIAIDGALIGGMVGPVVAGQPTTGTITFNATINESFIDAQTNDVSVDAYDTLVNNVTISGELTTNLTNYVSETSSASFGIVEPTYTKSIVGFINSGSTLDLPPFADDPLKVSPGDKVIFAIEVDIPAGDLEDLEITDFLPLPFFEASEINTTFDSTVYTPVGGNNSTVPAAGDVAWGDSTTGFPGALPTPVITKDVSENTLSIDFTDNTTFQETPSDGITIQLLFTVTATSDPFGDGLSLVNFASYNVDNSSNPVSVFNTARIKNVVTAMPGLDVYKGAVATDKGTATFTPATVGPTTFAAVGSSPSFTAPFSTTELQATTIESDISNVDGGDEITMAIVIDNFGAAEAHDIIITDTMPAGLSAASGGLNLQVYDAGGNDLGASTTGGLFGTIVTGGATDGSGDTSISFTGPLTYFDTDGSGSILTGNGLANEGENIIVVTYDVKIDNTVQPLEELENLGSLTKFAATSGGTNFVNEASKFQETAKVTIPDLSFTKVRENAAVGDQAGTTLPDVTIGEVVQYTVAVTVPEGTTQSLVLTDNIPSGLAYYIDNGVTIDTTSACAGTAFDGTVSAFTTSPTGSGLASSGADLTVTFTGNVVANNDTPDDQTDNTFCIEYDVVVLDEVGNDGLGVVITTPDNSATLTYGSTDSSGPQTATFDVAEPRLFVSKTPTPATGDAGDTIAFRIGISNSNLSNMDAFDLEITDTVPSGFTVVGDFDTDGLDNDGDGLVDGADADELAGGLAPFYDGTDTFTFNSTTTNNTDLDQFSLALPTQNFRYNVTVDNTVEPTEVISNTARVDHDNIPGTPSSPLFQRTGFREGTGDFTVNAVSVVSKTVNTTSEAHTGTGEHTADTDLAIGESVTYYVTLDIPESTIANLVALDTAPTGLRIDSASVFQDDTGAAAPTILITDAAQDTVSFTFASITNAPDGDTENIIFQIDATVEDDAVNINDGDSKTNTASVTWDNQVGGPATNTVDFDVVEPVLTINKAVNSATADAGNTLTYTVTVDHDAASTADAFDIVITDIIDGDLTYAANVVTNSGPAPTVNATGDPTITFSYDSVTTAGAPYEFTFDVTVNNDVSPAQVINNQATIVWDSLPGDSDPDERQDTTNDSVNVTINALNPTKTINTTSFTETGTAQFNGANQDLAIGEQVDYRLSIDIPESIFTDFVITDVMPGRFEVIGGSLIQDDGVTHTLSPTITITDALNSDGIDDTIEFDFGDITNTPDADTETIIVEVQAIVVDNVNNTAGTPYTNTASFDYTENGGPALTATVDVDVVEPSIAITKTVAALTGDAGDTFLYTLNVSNTGTGPAFDLEIVDDVPSDMTVNTVFATDGYDNDGDGSDGEVGSAYFSGNTFTWNNTTTGLGIYDQLDPASSFTLQYEVTMGVTANPGEVITNQADLIYDSGAGVVTDERDYTGDDDASVTVDVGGIAKVLRDADTEKTIGDTIPYRITVTVPEGTTAPLDVEDTLDAGLVMDPSTISISTSNATDVTWAGTPENPTQVPLSTAYSTGNQVLTFDFGILTNVNTDNGTAETVIIEYDAVVVNSSDNNDTNTSNNSAEADFGGLGTVGPVSAPNVTIVEPIVTIEDFSTTYVSGNTATISVRLENNATDASGIAHDVVLDSLIPAGFTYAGNVVLVNGPGLPTVNSTGDPTILFSFDQILTSNNNANPIIFTFDVTIPLGTTSGSVQNTTIDLEYTGQDGTISDVVTGNTLTNERTGDTGDAGGAVNDYSDSDNLNITVTRPDFSTSTKTLLDVNGGDIEAGDTLRYTIDAINTGNLDATGVQVTDDMPLNVNSFAVTSTPVGSTDASLAAPGGTNSTGLLDITSISVTQGDTESIVYTVVVDLGLTAGDPIDNTMTVEPATEGGPGGTDTASGTVTMPVLDITKTASSSSVNVGENVTYTIVVNNTGNAASTNTTIVDTIPVGLIFNPGLATLDGVNKTDVLDGDEGDYNNSNAGALTFIIPSLAAAGTATMTYTAQAITSGNFLNTVTVLDDQGSSGNDNAIITAALQEEVPTGGGGGGGGGGSICNGLSSDQCNKIDPPEVDEPGEGGPPVIETSTIPPDFHDRFTWDPIELCLKYDSQRIHRFIDVTNGTVGKNEARVLKGTYRLELGYKEDRQYVMSGYGTETNNRGAFNAGLKNSVTRLEWAKLMMISHCLEIFDATVLPNVNAFGEEMPVFEDYPPVLQSDPVLKWETDVMYSAAYYGILNGTEEKNAEPRRYIIVPEAIKMIVGVGEFVRAEELNADGNFVRQGIPLSEWYYPFYAKSATEGSLAEFLHTVKRVNTELVRSEGVDMLVDTILIRNLYHSGEDIDAVNAKLLE